MLGSISELREALKSCADGDLISHPNSLEDPYRNARVHQIGGDYAAARRSYLEYFKHNLPLLDPHLRFIAFLKVQEGTAGARETYNEIVDRNPGMTTNYACLLLLDREQRIAGLETLLACCCSTANSESPVSKPSKQKTPTSLRSPTS